MVAYKCDRCGKIFDWYETFYFNKQFNDMSMRERDKWNKEHPDTDYWEGSEPNFCANALKMVFYEPVNENCTTNNGKLSADIEECSEGNNMLIMLCPNCMTDFTRDLQEWWSNI